MASVTIAAGRDVRAASSAAWPSATSTTSNPSLVRRNTLSLRCTSSSSARTMRRCRAERLDDRFADSAGGRESSRTRRDGSIGLVTKSVKPEPAMRFSSSCDNSPENARIGTLRVDGNGAQPRRELEAVHVGQQQILENQIGPLRWRKAERARAVDGFDEIDRSRSAARSAPAFA